MGRRASLLLGFLLAGCLFGSARKGGEEKPPTWEERWAAIFGPGDEADRACHDEMLALRKAMEKGDRERIFRRMIVGLEKLAAARREAETLILEARKEAAVLDATVGWEEVVQAWVGTELHVRKLIPVEILEAVARESDGR
ncbi:MAG: hypothetical protein ACYS47_06390 [Planctomycetota bacterium]|jgi:hypothetical protein